MAEARKYDLVTFAPISPVGTVAAAGSTVADGGALTNAINYVTGADGTKGVVLPDCVPDDKRKGVQIKVINSANAVLKVYAASSSQIAAGSVDAAVSVAAYTTTEFILVDDTEDANVWWGTEPAAP